jgi:hypothetical protein
MYNLAYVERAEREPGMLSAPRRRFRIERFATVATALDRARAIIALPAISAVELHKRSGEVVFDARELAREIGATPRLGVALPPEDLTMTLAFANRRD